MTKTSIDENKVINIRKAEDSLFKEWAMKRHPFATDGCADSKAFQESERKIVFVLKERNWGHTNDDQKELQSIGYAEIIEERNSFNSWWTLMAKWADVLLLKENSSKSWNDIERSYEPHSRVAAEDQDQWIEDKNRKSLGRCACIQLKKAPGGGELNKEGLHNVVVEDKKLILRQLAIYSPHFIISCGSNDNWFIFTKILFQDVEIRKTHNGVNYFIAPIGRNNHKAAVINYGHPSMRINGALWGALAFGLRDAMAEIEDSLTIS